MNKITLVVALILTGCSNKPTVIGLSCIGSHTKNISGQETKEQDTTHYMVDLRANTVAKIDDDGVRKSFCIDGMTCKVTIDDNTIAANTDGPFTLAGPSGSAHAKLRIDRVSGHFVAMLTVLDGQPNDSYIETKVGMCESEQVKTEPTEHKF